MTAATKTYQFEGFNIDPLIEEFVKAGNFTYDTITLVFGPAPRIPDSPDMDARLEAWEDQAEYSSRIQRCEARIREIIAESECKMFDAVELLKRATYEYQNYGIIAPKTEKALMQIKPYSRTKLWEKVSQMARRANRFE